MVVRFTLRKKADNRSFHILGLHRMRTTYKAIIVFWFPYDLAIANPDWQILYQVWTRELSHATIHLVSHPPQSHSSLDTHHMHNDGPYREIPFVLQGTFRSLRLACVGIAQTPIWEAMFASASIVPLPHWPPL